MQKLRTQPHIDAARHGLNILESEIERLTHQVRALKIVNQSLKKNLKACTNADIYLAMVEENRNMVSILERLVDDFLHTIPAETTIDDFNSLRIASEHLQRIKGENNEIKILSYPLSAFTAQRDELLQTVKAVQTMCHGAIRVRID